MGWVMEDGKNIQFLALILLDVLLYDFWWKKDINKTFFFQWKMTCLSSYSFYVHN